MLVIWICRGRNMAGTKFAINPTNNNLYIYIGFQPSSVQIHQWRKATFSYNQGEGLEGDQGEEHPDAHFFLSVVSLTFPTPYPAGIVTSSRQSSTNRSSISDGNIPRYGARALNLYDGIPWLNSILNGSMLGFYSSVFKYSISIADVGYMCISSIIFVSIHELGHALAATSEGIQIEYTAVFLAALVAFNNEMLQMIPRIATLRIYCAVIWHNAAFCVVCALTVFLLPLILYPLYSHGESLMVLDVSARSPLYGYLSPGDLGSVCFHGFSSYLGLISKSLRHF